MKMYNLQALNHDMFLDFHGGFPLVFYPRIPHNRLKNEEGVTPRVCIAYEIGGCIRALPGSNKMSTNVKYLFDYKYAWGVAKGMVFAVNEFEIDDDDPHIVPNSELASKDLVPDADETGECWYLKELIANKTYFIFVDNVENVLMGDEAEFEKFDLFAKDCPVSVSF